MRGKTVYLALGSNLGDTRYNLELAIERIAQRLGEVVQSSRLYSTRPLNPPEIKIQPDFVNCVIRIRTTLSPFALLKGILQIESELGRKRDNYTKWGPRSIDIDIVAYDGIVLKTPALTIPHREMMARDFVLIPLKEVERGFIHPENHLSIDEMINRIKNKDKFCFIDKACHWSKCKL